MFFRALHSHTHPVLCSSSIRFILYIKCSSTKQLLDVFFSLSGSAQIVLVRSRLDEAGVQGLPPQPPLRRHCTGLYFVLPPSLCAFFISCLRQGTFFLGPFVHSLQASIFFSVGLTMLETLEHTLSRPTIDTATEWSQKIRLYTSSDKYNKNQDF